jgi:type IV secretory pathway VirB10-like protein
MRFDLRLLGNLLWLHGAVAESNQCPDTELACHDIMNSSQCISQAVLESGNAPVSVTKEAMIKCVEHEGTASDLPGAVKVRVQQSRSCDEQ